MHLTIEGHEYRIDRHDVDILNLLSQDGRMPFSDMAKRVGLSRAIVAARVSRMQEIGLIEKFTVNLHYSYSRKKTSAYFELVVSPAHMHSVALAIAEYDEICVVYQMSGGSILHVHGFFDGMEDIYTFVNTKLNTLEGLTNIKTEFILKKFKSDFV